jgi:hypothetical protein
MFVLLSLWTMFFWSTEWREYERQCTQCAYSQKKKETKERMQECRWYYYIVPRLQGKKEWGDGWPLIEGTMKRKKMLTHQPEFTGLLRLKTSGCCNPSFSISKMMSSVMIWSKSCAFYVGILCSNFLAYWPIYMFNQIQIDSHVVRYH